MAEQNALPAQERGKDIPYACGCMQAMLSAAPASLWQAYFPHADKEGRSVARSGFAGQRVFLNTDIAQKRLANAAALIQHSMAAPLRGGANLKLLWITPEPGMLFIVVSSTCTLGCTDAIELVADRTGRRE